jgi:hypothetical protein
LQIILKKPQMLEFFVNYIKRIIWDVNSIYVNLMDVVKKYILVIKNLLINIIVVSIWLKKIEIIYIL